ncbi:MAG: hypothetical protein CBE24_05085 [bacterium TMED264]|nr:MAG: hypothetical protein CBE24_05085 [bacterium TMED264]
MINKFYSITVIFIFTVLNAQFISELPTNNVLKNISSQGEDYTDLIEPLSRFNINYGFSTSMISDGKNFYSISGINNNFSYSLLNNLKFNGNVGLYIMQSPLQKHNPLMEQLSVAYDASITYQPFKNSTLQFRIQNIPHQKNYSPFYRRFNQ